MAGAVDDGGLGTQEAVQVTTVDAAHGQHAGAGIAPAGGGGCGRAEDERECERVLGVRRGGHAEAALGVPGEGGGVDVEPQPAQLVRGRDLGKHDAGHGHGGEAVNVVGRGGLVGVHDRAQTLNDARNARGQGTGDWSGYAAGSIKKRVQARVGHGGRGGVGQRKLPVGTLALEDYGGRGHAGQRGEVLHCCESPYRL